ncbi:MAG TPA: ATP-binding protein [Coriobacteriia bacterium]|nr:ATP-binding protein [Coriobacteriia bacterium]
MTPERIGLPSPPATAASPPIDPPADRAKSGRAVAIIVLMLLTITAMHLFTTTIGNEYLHLLYRRMYFIPIVYAAFVFGKRGGVLTACAATVPFAIHAQVSLNGVFDMGFDNALEIISYFAVGLLFGALRDLEENKTRDLRQVSLQLEEAYRKLEERAIQLINVQDYTSSILRSITSGVLTVGPDGSVATANPAAERMLAMSEFEMVPKPISSLFRDDGGISGDVAKVLSGRIPLALRETTLITPNGREVHVQSSTSRMRAVGGSVLGAVVTLEDVSDIRALTEQLIRADRLAAMGELTAGVAHEVRNPLGVIRASVQLLEDANCDRQRIQDAASVIKQEIDRLDRVIKALLDFGRPSKPTLVHTDVNDVLQDVVLFTSRFARQANVYILEELTSDIPPVIADPDQLKQVFLNLVTNAVQAMDDEGGNITITTKSDGDYVEVMVADTGPGIAPNDLSKIFDPFFTKRSDGTGLGLTIVHRIIDEHDGHIEVSSSPDGTTFTVSLPAAIEG